MANAANILPNYSMKGNIATGLEPPEYVIDTPGFNKIPLKNTWKNNNKYYYYNIDVSGHPENILTKVFKKNILTSDRDDNDDDNSKGVFDDIDDAIEYAACGNWNSTNGICKNEPYNGKGTYKNKNFIHTPSAHSVCDALTHFITNDPSGLPTPFEPACDPPVKKVSTDIFNSTVSYLISRIITEKSRFYSTEKLKNEIEQYTGWDGFTYFLTNSSIQYARVFIYIAYAISFYFLLVGLKAIVISPINKSGVTKSGLKASKPNISRSTFFSGASSFGVKIFRSTFISTTDFIVFFVVMLVIFFLSGIVFSDTSHFYILSSPHTSFLTEPCDAEPEKSNLQGLGFVMFVIIMMTFLLLFQNYFAAKLTESRIFIFYIAYFVFYISLLILIFVFCFVQRSADVTNDKTYLISYDIKDVNNNYFLPYIFKNTEQINYTFFLLLFSVVIIATIVSVVVSVFDSDKQKNGVYGKIFGYVYPFLTLRSPIITVCTLLVLYKVPFIFIIYPLLILIQRLIVGNLIAPLVLYSVLEKNQNNKTSLTVVFETLVGWDLLLWPLFKIADVTESFLVGEDFNKIGEQNSASNLNVFTSFSKEVGFKTILKVLLLASPVSFAIFFNTWPDGNERYVLSWLLGSGVLLFGLILVSYFFIWTGNKAIYYKDNYNIDVNTASFWEKLRITLNPFTRGILIYIYLITWLVLYYKTSKWVLTTVIIGVFGFLWFIIAVGVGK